MHGEHEAKAVSHCVDMAYLILPLPPIVTAFRLWRFATAVGISNISASTAAVKSNFFEMHKFFFWNDLRSVMPGSAVLENDYSVIAGMAFANDLAFDDAHRNMWQMLASFVCVW